MGKIIKNGRVYAGGIVVDSALDTTSENPIQNKVVAGAINQINSDLAEKIDKEKFNSNTLSYNPEWDGVSSKLNQYFRLDASNVFLIQCDSTRISFMFSSDNMQTWTTFWTK